MAGRLVLVATPLGNLDDLSPRAKAALVSADSWIVEDTRVSGRLQAVLGVKKPMAVLNDHTPLGRLTGTVESLSRDSLVALVTDAGTPGISDPGAELVDACHTAGISVDSIPGPSSPTLALSLSGFYAQRYAFLGFLPRKRGELKQVLDPFSESTLTLVAFESPHRVHKVLPWFAESLGERRYCLARELTKLHQQVWRGELPTPPSVTQVPAKGEFTVVIEGMRRRKVEKYEEG